MQKLDATLPGLLDGASRAPSRVTAQWNPSTSEQGSRERIPQGALSMTMALEFSALGIHHSDLVSPYISFGQPDGKGELLPEQEPSIKAEWVSDGYLPLPGSLRVMSSSPSYPHADRR